MYETGGEIMPIHIVFVEPEIPPNTGNIARSCAATGSVLHLVEPLGFSIDEKSVRRAGLDYWQFVNLEVHKSLEDFLEKYGDRNMYLATTKESNFIQKLPIKMETCWYSEKKQQAYRKTLLKRTKTIQ